MNSDSQAKVISPTYYSRELPYAKLPRNNTDVWIGNFPRIPYLRVCWHSFARFQILRHAYRTPEFEVGGVLIGGVYRAGTSGDRPDKREYWGDWDFPLDFVNIVYSLPAEQSHLSTGQFTFTTQAWAEMNLTLDYMKRDGTLLANDSIVGWYHTHPGHGLVLGGHDLSIQNNHFSSEFQLALVIETRKHEGVFYVDSAQVKGPYASEKFIWDRRFLSVHDHPVIPALYSQKDEDLQIQIFEHYVDVNGESAPARSDASSKGE